MIMMKKDLIYTLKMKKTIIKILRFLAKVLIWVIITLFFIPVEVIAYIFISICYICYIFYAFAYKEKMRSFVDIQVNIFKYDGYIRSLIKVSKE